MTTAPHPKVSSPLTLVRRWPTNTARAWGNEALPQLCAHPSVLAVVLLGSSVRKVTASFDLDCLYIYREDQPLVESVPIEVDLRGYRADQVSDLVASGHDLLVWSLRFGAMFCEKDQFWTRLKHHWQDKLPFPSADVAAKRAERCERLLTHLVDLGDEDATAEQFITALTHRSREALLRAGVFPASRPELPAQLEAIGASSLAQRLAAAIEERARSADRDAVSLVPGGR